jgi:(2Fe-2S) ferredoxin
VEKLGRKDGICLALCAEKHCARAGAKFLRQALEAGLSEHGLSDSVTVEWTQCQDFCDDAPSLTVLPEGLSYIRLSWKDAREIVESHLLAGEPVSELLDKKSRRRLMRRLARD